MLPALALVAGTAIMSAAIAARLKMALHRPRRLGIYRQRNSFHHA